MKKALLFSSLLALGASASFATQRLFTSLECHVRSQIYM